MIGEGWPPVAQRQDMLEEAIHIIRALHTGELVTMDGDYFRIDSARISDLPDDGVPIGIAVSSAAGAERFGELGDHLITTDPTAEILEGWSGDVADQIACGPDLDELAESIRE